MIIPKDKIIYVEDNFSLSFETNNENIVVDSPKTENNLKCYVPLSEIIMKENECSTGDVRCEQIIKEPRPVHVFVEVSSFNNFNKATDDGGAIHLIDCCLTCLDTPFIDCEANNGRGGAIFIENKLDYTNNITFYNLQFSNCKALNGGGAIFIYSVSDRVPISISKCQFNGCQIIESENPSKGGSAIYLNSRRGVVQYCKFRNNKGDSSVKIEMDSDETQRKIQSLVSSKMILKTSSILISDCNFEIKKDSLSSVKFVVVDSKTEIKVNKCIFTGNLADDAHHIDEQIIGKNSPKLMINSCKFSSNEKNSLKLDPNHNVNLIEFNNQVYNYSKNNISDSHWKTLTSIVLSTLLIMTVIVLTVIFYLKRKNNEVSGENESELIVQNFSL